MPLGLARPWLLASGIALSLVALPKSALAWVDVHVASDDVRMEVGRDGSARVEHKLTLRISGGPLRAIDLRGIDADAVPEADGYVVPAKEAATNSLANALPVATEMLPPPLKPKADGSPEPSAMRVRFDADKGLSRGVYVVFVRYRTELLRRGLLHRDGSMAKLEWSGLIWENGLDSARATFVLPPGPTEPRLEDAPTTGANGEPQAAPSVLSTLRRETGRDELELLRPYAPKGEAIAWALRFDSRALDGMVKKPEDVPSVIAPEVLAFGQDRRSLLLFAGGALFVLYSLLVAWKGREVERTTKEKGAEARPLVPIGLLARSFLAAVALCGGILLQLLLPTATVGALCVALAVLLSVYRAPRWGRGSLLRPPGAWFPISEEEAFAKAKRLRGAWLDLSTRAGKSLLFLCTAAVGAGAYYASTVSMYYAHLVVYDAVALLALFCTGRMAELPPDPVGASAPLLREIQKRIQKGSRKASGELRIVPRIRVPEGETAADELRLQVVPRAVVSGFLGLEVGVVLSPGAGSALRSPEVLLRVMQGSAAEALVEELVGGARSQRGRKPNERVYILTPRLPTAWMTADLVLHLLDKLWEARKTEERSGVRRTQKASKDDVIISYVA